MGLGDDGREDCLRRILSLRRLPTINLSRIPLRGVCVCVCVCARTPALAHTHPSLSQITGAKTSGPSYAWIGPESAALVLVPSPSVLHVSVELED